MIQREGFTIANLKMFKLTAEEVQNFFKTTQMYLPQNAQQIIEELSSDLIVAMELLGDQCLQKWKEYTKSVGSSDLYGSQDQTCAYKEIEFFFSKASKLSSPANFNNCTCAVIKPHAITEKNLGAIIDHILSAGF